MRFLHLRVTGTVTRECENDDFDESNTFINPPIMVLDVFYCDVMIRKTEFGLGQFHGTVVKQNVMVGADDQEVAFLVVTIVRFS